MNRYTEPIQFLGEGTFGDVMLVEHKVSGEKVRETLFLFFEELFKSSLYAPPPTASLTQRQPYRYYRSERSSESK